MDRRRGVLRRVRLPHHDAAHRGAGAPRAGRPRPVLAAPGPPAAAGARRDAGRGRHRHAGRRVGGRARAACGATCRGRSPTSATGARSSATCPYYAADPPLLRHLWSLAIEEQFYLVWPLVFVALARTRLRSVSIAQLLAGARRRGMVWTSVCSSAAPARSAVRRRRPRQLHVPVDVHPLERPAARRRRRVRVAAVARHAGARPAIPAGPSTRAGVVRAQRARDRAAIAATLTAGYVYQWLLPLVIADGPGARARRRPPGARRASGPCSRGGRSSRSASAATACTCGTGRSSCSLGATHGSVGRFVVAAAITVVVTELSYRYVETPARRGALGRWWRTAGPARSRVLLIASCVVVLVAGCYGRCSRSTGPPAAPMPTFGRRRRRRSRRRRRRPALAQPRRADALPPAAAPTGVAIVGDSQAHSLAVNVPDGSRPRSASPTAPSTAAACTTRAACAAPARRSATTSRCATAGRRSGRTPVTPADASVALVVLGAWDVFDLETGDGSGPHVRHGGVGRLPAGQQLQEGIDALVGAGAQVALLEVPCMRPISVEGAAVPPLPERGDDARVAHVNELWRAVAAANAATTTFVTGPDWCGDEAIATRRRHAVGRRARVQARRQALIFDTIAPTLLAACRSPFPPGGIGGSAWPMAPKKSAAAKFTVPGMTTSDGTEVATILQDRLNALTDLHLTLKHVHWNVVGPHFIAVHEMLDPQVDAVRAMTDETAERIATLGVSPIGTPGALVAARTLGRLRHRPGRRHRAPRRPRRRLHRRHREPPQGDRRHRGARPGHPGHADRPGRAARAVPLVRPRPPREHRWRAVDGRRDPREDGRQEGRRRRQARPVASDEPSPPEPSFGSCPSRPERQDGSRSGCCYPSVDSRGYPLVT